MNGQAISFGPFRLFAEQRLLLVLLQTAPATTKPSEDLFRQALDLAHQQGTLWRELRATTSLARLLSNQGRQAEAIICLQPVYDRLAEGFGTAELMAAKRILEGSDHR